MTTLDQRILIPSSPDAVWDVISNINKNPNWQVDCQEISLLSSRRTGPGARWRYVSANRSEYVVEITAWYDRLGYEYTFIDGVPFRESRGRIRLQEIPEGTVVQWSLTYEIGGVFSGLRNSLSIQRQFEKTMAESLKALYSHVRTVRSDHEVGDAKSLMRDAPDYEARAQYVPRHPSRFAEREEEQSGDSEPLIPEPALTDDDTRPNPAITAAEAGDSAPAIRQPVELEPVEPPVPEKVVKVEPETTEVVEPAEEEGLSQDSAHARFKPPARTEAPAVQAQAPAEIPEIDAAEEQLPEPSEPIEPGELVEESEAVEPAADTEQPEVAAEPPAATTEDETETVGEEQAEAQDASLPLPDPLGPKIDTTDLDTKEISIWEVFGVPRPSDTRPIQAVREEASDNQALPEVPVADAEMPPAEETPPTAEDTQPTIAAANVEIIAEPPILPPAETPAAETSPAAGVAESASEVVAVEPITKLSALQPDASLPRGFRFLVRRNLVNLRRRH